MTKRWGIVLAALGLSALLGACSSSAKTTSTGAEPKTTESASASSSAETTAPTTASTPEVTTEAAPTSAAAPAAPVTFTGSGSAKSAPAAVAAGDYTITFDYGSCPVAGGRLILSTAPDDFTSIIDAGSAPDPPAAGETNAYGVAAGKYFADVYSCPQPWSITLTPQS